MRILFIAGSLNQGGAEFQLLQLAKLFKEHEHEVEVFAITDYDFYKPFVYENKIKYSHLYNSQAKIKRIWLTSRKIKSVNPDIIISFLKVPSQVALLSKLLCGSKAKIIVGERTSYVQPWLDKFHFNLMRLANFVTVNSIVRLNQLKKDYPRIRNKLIFIPNIIDLEKFSFTGLNKKREITKLGYFGRVSPEKNLLKLVEAIKILKDKNYKIELLVYGDTKDKNYLFMLKDLIKLNRLDSEIFLKGKTNDINSAYSAIDLICLLSDYEGFSNVISEAMCCGKPVITSNIEENKFLVENNINGFVVDHKNSFSIAKGIINYIKLSEDLKIKMAQNNRTKTEKLFDKEKIFKEYMKLIELEIN